MKAAFAVGEAFFNLVFNKSVIAATVKLFPVPAEPEINLSFKDKIEKKLIRLIYPKVSLRVVCFYL